MSEAGKLKRGEAYYNMRDKEGKIPAGVESNPDKMSDLNYFLEAEAKIPEAKPKDKEK